MLPHDAVPLERHGRFSAFQMAEIAAPRKLFGLKLGQTALA